MIGAGSSRLAAELERAIDVCDATLAAYAERAPEVVESRFASELRLATAAMQTLATCLEQESATPETAMLIAATLCRTAAAEARRYGLDDEILLCAAACDRVVALLEPAL